MSTDINNSTSSVSPSTSVNTSVSPSTSVNTKNSTISTSVGNISEAANPTATMVHSERRARRKRSKKSSAHSGAAANCWAKNSKEARRGDEACVSGASGRGFLEAVASSVSSSVDSGCDAAANEVAILEPLLPPQEDISSGQLTEESISRIIDLLSREPDYHPKTDFLFRIDSAAEDKVDARLRDEAIYNLRFLHKFYNLSPECFAHAVNIADRFVVKVKVKPKYMACLATAAYLIAAKMIEDRCDWPVPQKLVCMARCGGSANDLERMEAIIRSKLRDQHCLEEAVTPLHFLMELRPLFPCVQAFQRAVGELETSLCSVAVYDHRPCALALAIARKHLASAAELPDGVANGGGGVLEAAGLLAQLCDLFQLQPESVSECESAVNAIVGRLQARTPAPRLLVWAVSRRTLVSLMRPSAAAHASLLDPIRED